MDVEWSNSQVHAILKDGAPVFLLRDTLLVSLREGRVVVQLEVIDEVMVDQL